MAKAKKYQQAKKDRKASKSWYPPAQTSQSQPHDPRKEESMAKAKKDQKAPKGWFVNPPKEITDMILARCEESMREPKQEIVWLLRDWMRQSEALDKRSAELDEREQRLGEGDA